MQDDAKENEPPSGVDENGAENSNGKSMVETGHSNVCGKRSAATQSEPDSTLSNKDDQREKIEQTDCKKRLKI